MTSVNLQTANLDQFLTALDAVEISVSHGRHFKLPLSDEWTTMKEMTAKFKTLSIEGIGNPENFEKLYSLRNKLITLNFQADAKLANSEDCCARFNAAIRRFFGGTSGENYHLDQLMPVKQSTLTLTDDWVKEICDANLIPSNKAIGAQINAAHLIYRTNAIKHQVTSLRPNSDNQKTAELAVLNSQVQDAWTKIVHNSPPEIDTPHTFLQLTNKKYLLSNDQKIDLFNELAKTYPLLACIQLDYIADVNSHSIVEKLAIMARVKDLNKIIKQAFREADKHVVNKPV